MHRVSINRVPRYSVRGGIIAISALLMSAQDTADIIAYLRTLK
jgi:hypothetical protein